MDGFASIELLRTPGLREPPPDLDRRFTQAGARRSAFVTWTRKKPFSVEGTPQITGSDPALFIHVEGSLRSSDGGVALPFSANSQWTGSAPLSLLDLRLADRRIHGRWCLPSGNPLAAARHAELLQLLAKLGGTPREDRFVRASSGDRLEQ